MHQRVRQFEADARHTGCTSGGVEDLVGALIDSHTQDLSCQRQRRTVDGPKPTVQCSIVGRRIGIKCLRMGVQEIFDPLGR